MINRSWYSSDNMTWETPDHIYEYWNKQFNFQLDVCANGHNAKCDRYYTKSQNGLKLPWADRNWCNPPYGKDQGKWVEQATQKQLEGKTTVMVLPSRTDTRLFHRFIYLKPGVDLHLLKGRLKFKINIPLDVTRPNSRKIWFNRYARQAFKHFMVYDKSVASAPFPSMIVIFWGNPKG